MKQALQDLSTGRVVVMEVPPPEALPGFVLVRTEASVISAGTEGMQIADAGRSMAGTVASRPELLKKAFGILRSDGLDGLRQRIRSKYTGYAPLGYSAAGVVIAAGPGVARFSAGQRVACAGAGYACHAEAIAVPANLCSAIPEGVSAESAAYTTLGSIALQGVRQAQAAIGECIAIVGLGLIGLLSAQVLKAAGCSVLGIDPSAAARRRGLACGCDRVADPEHGETEIQALSLGLGADAVIICAATSSSEPLLLAGRLARSRGRVVMVGTTGMELPRDLYFRKELSFALSRSYGPGRYDPTYEEGGTDYPADYVRFTEERNMVAFLGLAQASRVDPARLTTHRFPLDDAPKAYALLADTAADRAGVLLEYPQAEGQPLCLDRCASAKPLPHSPNRLRAGIIGAGAYATRFLIPALARRKDVALRGVCTRKPEHAAAAAGQFAFDYRTCDAGQILDDPDTDAVFIATRHDTHAELAARALAAGKHVWVEKPLALTLAEAHIVCSAMREHPDRRLAIGFNRRCSPLTPWIKEVLASPPSPMMISYRIYAGYLPKDHWTQDPAVGGGRLVGEGCHFIDFLCFLTEARVARIHVAAVGSGRADIPAQSNFAATLTFDSGSVGQILYSSLGMAGVTKEYIEVFLGDACVEVDDFQSASFVYKQKHGRRSLPSADKGQRAMVDAFVEHLLGRREAPISAEALMHSTCVTLAAQESLLRGSPIDVAEIVKAVVAP